MTRTLQDKKLLERWHVDLFRGTLPNFPPGELVSGESPDLCVLSPEGKIGIEVTRVFKDSRALPLQIQEAERRLVVERASSIYKGFGLPFVDVHVYFSADTSFHKTNRDRFAMRLAKLVARNASRCKPFLTLDNGFEDSELFPFEFVYVSMIQYDKCPNFWSVVGGGWVQEDFRAELQQVLDRKNMTFHRLEKSCLEQWLLIVIEFRDESTMFEPSNETLEHAYRSLFDRTFLLEQLTRRVHELAVADVTKEQ